MSYRTISRKRLRGKLSLLAVIVLVFGILLFLYAQNQEAITHFKPYYLKAYWYVARYEFQSLRPPKPVPVSTQTAKSVPVLVYHGILKKPDRVSPSIDQFAAQMFALKAAGYQTVSLDDFSQYLGGNKNLPDKSFLLTFDDGRKDSYYPADPILRALNYRAVMFVITGTLTTPTNPFHLTTPEFVRMVNSGRWYLQAHTYEGHGLIRIDAKGAMGHFYSNKMWLADKNRLETDAEFKNRITADLLRARLDMRNYFGIRAYAFAFPFNDYARDSINFPGASAIFNQASQKIYSLLFYQAEPSRGFATNLFGSKRQRVRRINVETTWSASDLIAVLTAAREKDLPLTYKSFDPSQGWIRTKGVYFFGYGKLNLNADELTNAAIVLLNGTSSFQNYQETVNITWDKGSDFTMILNQREIADYYTVTISQDQIKVGKVVSDNGSDIYKKTINFPSPHGDHTLGYRIIGDKLTVSVDGEVVLSDFSLGDSAPNGGLGFEVWDRTPNNAAVTIKELHIESTH